MWSKRIRKENHYRGRPLADYMSKLGFLDYEYTAVYVKPSGYPTRNHCNSLG